MPKPPMPLIGCLIFSSIFVRTDTVFLSLSLSLCWLCFFSCVRFCAICEIYGRDDPACSCWSSDGRVRTRCFFPFYYSKRSTTSDIFGDIASKRGGATEIAVSHAPNWECIHKEMATTTNSWPHTSKHSGTKTRKNTKIKKSCQYHNHIEYIDEMIDKQICAHVPSRPRPAVVQAHRSCISILVYILVGCHISSLRICAAFDSGMLDCPAWFYAASRKTAPHTHTQKFTWNKKKCVFEHWKNTI